MSHVIAMKLEVQDLDALAAACEAVNCELVRGQETFRWFGSWVNDYHAENAAYRNGFDPKNYGKCVHAIRCKGMNAYEIGVCENPNGEGFTLVYDNWMGGIGLEARVGKQGCNLLQNYTLQASINLYSSMGFMMETVRQENGEIQVIGSKL